MFIENNAKITSKGGRFYCCIVKENSVFDGLSDKKFAEVQDAIGGKDQLEWGHCMSLERYGRERNEELYVVGMASAGRIYKWT